MQNALFTSREKGKRNFVSKDGYGFGWRHIQEQWNRDRERAIPETKLCETVVNGLDGWVKMNVSYVKAVFHEKTIAEAVAYICTTTDIEIPKPGEHLYEENLCCY